MPSGIPTPVATTIKKSGTTPADAKVAPPATTTTTGSATRQRSLNGKKPRISRSKVIARLASQRAASGSSNASTSGSTAAGGTSNHNSVASIITPKPNGKKARSSLGAKVKRSIE